MTAKPQYTTAGGVIMIRAGSPLAWVLAGLIERASHASLLRLAVDLNVTSFSLGELRNLADALRSSGWRTGGGS